MPATASASSPALSPAAMRWTGALAIVLVLHGAAAWLLLTRAIAPISLPAAPEAVMLDLAPDLPPIQPASIAPAAPSPPSIVTPEPQPVTPEPPGPPDVSPAELPLTPPVVAEVQQPMRPTPPRPKPKPTPPPRRVERQQPSPITDAVERPTQPIAPAPVQTAPQASPRPPAPASSIPTSWRSDLLGRLQRAKRYPDLARSHGDQGVALVSFTMDRAGRVLSVALVRSSGSPLLDEEAAALVRRAEPLPHLPDEVPGNTLTLTVPISFALR